AGVGEGDALVVEGAVAGGATHLEVVAREGAEHLVEGLVVRAGLVGPREHLVPCGFGCVAVEGGAHLKGATCVRFRVHFEILPVRDRSEAASCHSSTSLTHLWRPTHGRSVRSPAWTSGSPPPPGRPAGPGASPGPHALARPPPR